MGHVITDTKDPHDTDDLLSLLSLGGVNVDAGVSEAQMNSAGFIYVNRINADCGGFGTLVGPKTDVLFSATTYGTCCFCILLGELL